ncbi:hypothetical protein [Micromonospora sp. RTP1Z1]|uniref:hypothetical protein n=1 Tax=Micromonospora sp. RTP1Z1 TaxID=2994043 RepID=UPI0029C929D3|nr:hypothetical protein [Micromonospora sp. RTP1Z1]
MIVALASARGRRPYQNAEPGPPAATMPLPDLPPTTASRATAGAVPLQFHFEDTGTTRPARCAVDGVGRAGL